MKIQLGKLENQFQLLQHPNHKIPGNKTNQRGKGFVLKEREITHERNGRKLKRWKTIAFSWIRRINIVKMCILPRAIDSFHAIAIKIPPVSFKELEQTHA